MASSIFNYLSIGPQHGRSSLQWYIVVTRKDILRDSPPFVLQGREVYIRFENSGGSCVVSLMGKSEHSSEYFLLPFNVAIHPEILNDPRHVFQNPLQCVYQNSLQCVNGIPAVIWQTIDNGSEPNELLYRFSLSFIHHSGDLIETKDIPAKCELDDGNPTVLQSNLEHLSLDFSKILGNSTYADVQIQCSEGVVQAHRTILASRSKVFDRMFQADMQESRTGIVKLVDTEMSAVKLFLQFIYSGKIGSPSVGMVYCLYKLADKYDVPTLKNLCTDLMARHVFKKRHV